MKNFEKFRIGDGSFREKNRPQSEKIAKAHKICYTKIRQKKKEGQNKCGNKQKRVAFYTLRLQGKPI